MAVLQWIAFVIYIIAGILMTLAILLQEGKGGGLAGLGGAHAEATFGATNPLRRFTVIMAVIFLFLASFLSFTGRGAQMKIKQEKPSQEAPAETAPTGDAKPDEASKSDVNAQPANTGGTPAEAVPEPVTTAPADLPAPAPQPDAAPVTNSVKE
jgi:protein translocase SecG subunit